LPPVKVTWVLKQRIITAVVLAAAFVAILFFLPPQPFAFFLALVAALGAWEWANLCHITHRGGRLAYSLALVAIGAGLWLLLSHTDWISLHQVLWVACLWWALALLWIQGYPSSAVLWQARWVRMLMGVLVLVPCLLSLLHLRSLAGGHFMVMGLVLLVATADIGAYFAGRALGHHKLAPKVSPGKSWEGVAGGALAVVLLSLIYAWLRDFPVGTMLAITLPAALISVVGDLLESMLKRFRGIKDSGQLLPGHGGILDRIDGLTAAAPVFTLAVISVARLG
jgi:phosphatidate cytidylyltransferase